MRYKVYIKFFMLICIFLISTFFIQCEYDAPVSLWESRNSGTALPVITTVEPASLAFSGITKITIRGENFASVPELNIVYFNQDKGTILSVSPNEITVLPPNVAGDSMSLKVVVNTALYPAVYNHPFTLENALYDFVPAEQVYSIAFDKDDNLYTHARGKVVNKITPTGQVTAFATTDFAKSSVMRIGPGGYLYVQKFDNKFLYRIPPTGGMAVEFFEFPRKTNYFDFDQYGNIYSGGIRTGIYVLSPDSIVKTFDNHKNFTINAIRVFEDYVYAVVTGDVNGIWKSKIISTAGDLEAPELVFDWANSGDFSQSVILDITFSANGDLYVGTNHNELLVGNESIQQVDPILIIHRDGTTENLYPGIIRTPATHLCWGNGTYLYMNRWASGAVNSGVIRINTGVIGAPYYGRQ